MPKLWDRSGGGVPDGTLSDTARTVEGTPVVRGPSFSSVVKNLIYTDGRDSVGLPWKSDGQSTDGLPWKSDGRSTDAPVNVSEG